MVRKSFLAGCLWLFVIVSASAQEIWPTKAWPLATPKSVHLNADSLILLDHELASGAYGPIDGMLIIRHGKIAYEKSYTNDYAHIYEKQAKEESALNSGDPTGPYNYFNPWWHPFYHESKLHSLQSVTKTITSVIIGVAIKRNDFPSLNTPMIHFFDTTRIKNIDARKRNLTILHLLTMTAGFDWNENLPYTDSNNTGSQMEASSDWVKYTVDRPMSDDPGKVFNYNSGATQILAYIFRMATGKDIEEYAVKNLFDPLGIKNHYWKRTPSGLADCEGGLYLEKTDLAKIFYLFLKNGKWEDQQIVSEEWVKQSVNPYIRLAPNLAYGYKWWLSSYGDKDAEIVWGGNGFGGQYPMIFPEYDMVVVFMAWIVFPQNFSKRYNSRFVISKVLGAVDEYNNAKK